MDDMTAEEHFEFDHPFELNILMLDPDVLQDLPVGMQRLVDFQQDHQLESTNVGIPSAEITLESAHTHIVQPTTCSDIGRHWILDSGAISHYIKDISRFRSFSWLEVPVKVSTGKGPLWGLARGEVELVVLIGRIIIGGVLLIPDLDVDSYLLSVTALMDKGFSITFEGGKANIHKDNKVWATASPDNGNIGLCYLDEFELVQHFALAASCTDKQSLETWHKRLGRIQQRSIKTMSTKVTGLVIGDPAARDRNIDCVDCIRGTQHQHISRFPFSKASRPLERISFDIAGKMRVPDCTWNYQYLLVIIDHFTRYTWVFPLIKRDMALRAFEIFRASAENQCNQRLRVIQSDNAKEFVGKKWTAFCQNNGIEHITSQPYAPSMNSYVERVIRTIVNHASTMLWSSVVNESFWALACKASTYLLNRSSHSSLDNNITPYELWHGTKPHVGHIRIWGCRAYAAIPKERRTKFDNKSRDCVLIGFYDVENLYQLWDITAKQSIKCRDVIFHEHILGHPDIARSPIPVNQLITGVDRVIGEDDSVEELYPAISYIKPEIWNDIPAMHLPVHDIVSDSVPTTYDEAIASPQASDWIKACASEFKSMLHNKVFVWAQLPQGLTALPSKWIFTIKRRLDGTVDKYKARIVAGGHKQRDGIDFQETYAPVAKFVSLRILLAMAALDDLEGEQCDIVTAFLYGELYETVYMRSPPGITPKPGDHYLTANPGNQCSEPITDNSPPLYWYLKKSLYGLRQSPRCFYKKLDEILCKHGYKRITADYGVWMVTNETLIIAYVDDMQLLGTQIGLERILTVLGKNFLIKRMGPIGTHLFLGLQIERDRKNRLITISQSLYARQILRRYEMSDCTPCSIPMDPKEDWSPKNTDTPLPDKTIYQSAIGSLIYLMLGSRPDLSFSINKLAQYSSQPTVRHWQGVKRILRYVKGTINAKLTLGLHKDTGTSLVMGYFDAAFMDNSADRHSSMGYVFFVAGSPVSWAAKKQRVVALSTTDAEYLAGTEATKEAMWIHHFLTEIGVPKERVLPMTLFGDN